MFHCNVWDSFRYLPQGMNIDKKLDKVKPAQEKSGQPAGAHFSFLGMKRPGVSPLPSGWEPVHKVTPTPFAIHRASLTV